MLIYIISLAVFLIISTGLYFMNKEKEPKTKTILIRNILPGFVVALLVFIIIKYRDSGIFNQEPLYPGNYFD